MKKSLFLAFGLLLFVGVLAYSEANVSGVVHDPFGKAVAHAKVSVLNARQTSVASTSTDSDGRFILSEIPGGSYILVVSAVGFAEYRSSVSIAKEAVSLQIALNLKPVKEEVTVTADVGIVEKTEAVSQQVNVISEGEIQERARTVVAQVVEEEVGVQLQRTSSTISGVFVRGLTGNKVNVFIDGVRYSTSAQRGGINSFLDMIDPAYLQGVEILRGPNSAQYGSDALGGSLQFLSRNPLSGEKNKQGSVNTFLSSADASFGSSLLTSYTSGNFAMLADVAARRVNTLRPGEGLDSHNAVTRFFGLSSDIVIGNRLPDTAFTQYGGMLKMSWAPVTGSHFTANYMRSQQDGGQRYDQLLGGDGNLIADLRNFMLDLFYLRYDRISAGWFDNITATYSFNTQREERVNQGGNGNPRASINHEYERTSVNGLQILASKQAGTVHSLLFGAEYYHERIDSPSFGFNPVTRTSTVRRPRVPDNARYDSWGVYAQDVLEPIPNKLRLTANLRYSGASYEARAEEAPLSASGKPLWPDDSLYVNDVTFRTGAVYALTEGFSLLGNFSRGFRAPHMTDLGTLGLTGSGFEVAAPDVAGLNATIGSTAGSDAVSTGMPVQQLKPETSLTYEVGGRYHSERVDMDLAFFVNDINDNITKQALILPQGAAGLTLSDQVITAQNPNGVVFVEASPNPVLVRANFDDAQLYGFEYEIETQLASEWSLEGGFTYVHARDKRTDLPPNIEGGTPAPNGFLKLKYSPRHRSFWIEPYAIAAARQDRLSSLDLEDRRTGATRTLNSIANFFLNGATARGLVNPGPDHTFGSSDDFLIATGETLAQIQQRVLGPSGAASPLFRAIPGYVTFNVRFGYRFSEHYNLLVELQNIGDRNYRGISWGLDAPGRGVYVNLRTRF